MEILKETISLIKQDLKSKKISSIQSISSNNISFYINNEDLFLVDCDLDSVLCIGKYDLAVFDIITSGEGISFTGLMPVITIDSEQKVLMQAFLNKEALLETFRTGYATYFSRSRGKIWLKGESSDHKQEIINVKFSKKDSFFIYEVKQKMAACHEGFYSCFYRKINPDGSLEQIDFDRKFIPKKVYG